MDSNDNGTNSINQNASHHQSNIQSMPRTVKWNVESIDDSPTEQLQKPNVTPQAKPIMQRRRSARLMSQSEREDEQQEDKRVESPPAKKQRGRPAKKKKTQTKSPAAPPSGGGSGSTSTADQNENSSVQNVGTSHDDKLVDTGINPRCELSGAILELFADYRRNSRFKARYSARCTLCQNDDDSRKNYLKGNITNLKLHLQRVSIKFSCVRARACILFCCCFIAH